MRKKVFMGVSISLAVILICLVVILLTIYFATKPTYTELILSPRLCELALYTSPEKFVESQGASGNISLKNGYTDAKIDKDGNLVLILSEKELKAWKNARPDLKVLQSVLGSSKDIGVYVDASQCDEILKPLIENADTCGFEISDDYSLIIASHSDNVTYFPFILSACLFMQIIEGKTEVGVEYYQYNEVGEIIDYEVYPKEMKIGD